MWIYNGEVINEFPMKAVGFVYLITCPDGRKYIGKKLLTKSKTKQIKGKKKKIRVESDWREYYGSNEELNKLVEVEGRDNFKREILHICYTKSECSYIEAKIQFMHGALESEEYLNSWIMVRVRKSHILKQRV